MEKNKTRYQSVADKINSMKVGDELNIPSIIREIWQIKSVDKYVTRSFDVYFSKIRKDHKGTIVRSRLNQSITRIS